MIETYLAKFSSQRREALSDRYRVIWEDDHTAIECRSCGVKFSFFWRKHHCRYCGSLYCDICAPHNVMECNIRKCIYCSRALSPSNALYDVYKNVAKLPFIVHTSTRGRFHCKQPCLTYGSLYDDNFVRPLSEAAHNSGYFQFTNRSMDMCCVKLLSEGCNIYHEVFRPPYLSLPPKESVYSLIEKFPFIYLLVLYDNPYRIVEGESIVYNSTKVSNISPCASVKNFRKFCIYKARSKGRNVLVKFNELGKVELRSGKGRRLKYKAAELFSNVLNSSNKGDDSQIEVATLDFESNVDSIEEILYM